MRSSRVRLNAFVSVGVASLALVLGVACAQGETGLAAASKTVAEQKSPPAATIQPQAVAKAPQKPLVLTVSTEPATLDYQATNDEAARIPASQIIEPLLERNAQGQIVPWLATAYRIKDERTWSVSIRPNVKFSNGEVLDAEAAAAAINRIISRDFQTNRGSYIQGISGARAVDATTLEITTNAPDPVMPVRLTSIPIVPPVAARQTDFPQRPVGTGPFQMTSWERGRAINLVANPGYWGDRPAISDASVRVVPDRQTALAALQANEVDLVVGLLPEQTRLAPKVESVQATEFSFIQFNTLHPAMRDKRVRIAMNLAVDKETLARSVYQGHAIPSRAQNLAAGMVGFNPRLTPFPFDQARARALLAEAGYPSGVTLQLWAPIGRFLKGEETAEYVAAQLTQVGVASRPSFMEWTAYQTASRIRGDQPNAFDLRYLWNSNEWFDASRIEAHVTCTGGSSKYCNPRVDELLRLGNSSLDPAVRQRAYEDMWATIYEDPSHLFLLQQHNIYGLATRLVWKGRLDGEIRISEMRFA